MHYAEREIEVRYSETDQMGVVYHANYLVWLELGRTEFVRTLGFEYKDMEKAGVLAPVTKATLEYKHSARYGQNVVVKTWLKKVSQFRVIYCSTVINDQGELCVSAEVETTCVDKDTFKLLSFKKNFPELHQAYEKALNVDK